MIERNAIMVWQGLCYAGAQFYLPLPIAITINNTSPLFVFIFDYLINGVTINLNQFFGILLSIVGVVLAVFGPYFMSLISPDIKYESMFKNYESVDPLVQAFVGIVLLLTMVAHAYAVLMTKRLYKINSVQLNFVIGVMIAFSGALLVPSMDSNRPEEIIPMSTYLWSFLTSGIPITYGQLAYIAAVILTKHTGVLLMLSFSTIIFGYVLSVYRYN